MPVIAIMNQKGGVGKTTIAFNLAKGLSERNYKILSIDNDPQGNLTGAFLEDPTQLEADVLNIYQDNNADIKPQKISDNQFLIGSNIKLAKITDNDFDIIFRLDESIEKYKNNFDFILVDCIPSFGYLNMAALNTSDYVLIPTMAAPFALAGLKDLFDTINKTKKRINKKLKVLGIVLNLVEGRKTTISHELEEVIRETYRELVFKTKINKGVKVEESPTFRQSIMEYDSKSKQAKQFNLFIDEILERI